MAGIYLGKGNIEVRELNIPEDVTDVLKIMESGTWDIESIITHEFSLDNISKAIETAAKSNQAFIKILS